MSFHYARDYFCFSFFFNAFDFRVWPNLYKKFETTFLGKESVTNIIMSWNQNPAVRSSTPNLERFDFTKTSGKGLDIEALFNLLMLETTGPGKMH